MDATLSRPPYEKVLAYAKRAVRAEADNPSGWSYERQTVEHDILNRFCGLTNSDEDEEFIVDAIRAAEAEYNEANDVDL